MFAVVLAMLPALIIFWSTQSVPGTYVKRILLTPEVRAGEIFKVKIVRDVALYCDAKVKRQIVDAAGYVWEQGIKPRPTESEYTVELPIPQGAKEGRAKYHAEIYWSCNPWQRWYPKVTVQQETYFTILPSKRIEKLEKLPNPEELEKLKDGVDGLKKGVDGLQKQQQQLKLELDPETSPAAEWR